MLSISACQSITATSEYCVIDFDITLSHQDKLTDETAREILVHNETHDRICNGH